MKTEKISRFPGLLPCRRNITSIVVRSPAECICCRDTLAGDNRFEGNLVEGSFAEHGHVEAVRTAAQIDIAA